MKHEDVIYDACRAVTGLNPSIGVNLQKILAWIEPYKSRLHRVVVIDEYRVRITPFMSLTVEPPLDYTLGSDPNWITERIAVLRILPLPPPPNLVPGVGMRIDETTFWIIAPEDADGQDA